MQTKTNNFNVFILTATVLFVLLMLPFMVGAAPDNTVCVPGGPCPDEFITTYTPLSPLGDGSVEPDITDPTAYINNIFQYFYAIVAVLAVIKLIICGMQYMTSEAISSKEAAKKCIWAVIIGLALILLSVLILTTIQSDITSLNFFSTLKSTF